MKVSEIVLMAVERKKTFLPFLFFKVRNKFKSFIDQHVEEVSVSLSGFQNGEGGLV